MSNATCSLHLENQKCWSVRGKLGMIGMNEMFRMEDAL